MRKLWFGAGIAALVAVFAVAAVAIAGGGGGRHGFKAHLSGYQETPSISSPATGRFRAKVNGSQIDYKLSYSGFETPVMAAHIHLGQFGVDGGVAAFLCGGGGKPACPSPSGEVTGTIVEADVIGPENQGIVAPDKLGKLIEAMRHGVTYVNVHSEHYTEGEIRGQIGGGGHKFGFGQKGSHGWGPGGRHGGDD